MGHVSNPSFSVTSALFPKKSSEIWKLSKKVANRFYVYRVCVFLPLKDLGNVNDIKTIRQTYRLTSRYFLKKHLKSFSFLKYKSHNCLIYGLISVFKGLHPTILSLVELIEHAYVCMEKCIRPKTQAKPCKIAFQQNVSLGLNKGIKVKRCSFNAGRELGLEK